MILLLDIGNTNLKWAWQDSETLAPGGQAALTEIGVDVIATSQWSADPPPERMVVASVAAADVLRQLQSWVRDHWDLEIEQVRAQGHGFGVTNGYPNPEQLGVDRWLALIAARHLTTEPVCVVDCGTAVTIDLMDAQGRHLGGLIAPGYDLAREALFSGTQIPRDDPAAPADTLLATDTASAVRNGWLHGLVGLIAQVTGGDTAVVLTGSSAKLLLPLLAGSVDHQPDLVFQGLAMVAAAGSDR